MFFAQNNPTTRRKVAWPSDDDRPNRPDFAPGREGVPGNRKRHEKKKVRGTVDG